MQLVASPDRVAFAQLRGLEADHRRARVVIELSGDLPAALSPSVVTEARYASSILAQVVIDDLCRLAGQPSVTSVRAATRGVPGQLP